MQVARSILMPIAALSALSIQLMMPWVASAPAQDTPAKGATGTLEQNAAVRYGLSGKMITRPGQRDAVVALLLRDVDELKDAGCDLYVVSVSPQQPDAIWVTEVWASREAHRASLKLPTVRQAIAEAMPLLTDQFESVELAVVGGLGVPKRPAQ